MLVGAAILLAPSIVYNAQATGRFVPVTAQGGINFYLGNRSGSTGFFQGLDGARMNARGILDESKAMAEAETGRRMTQSEASDYYTRRALADIRSDPAGVAPAPREKARAFPERRRALRRAERLFRREIVRCSQTALPPLRRDRAARRLRIRRAPPEREKPERRVDLSRMRRSLGAPFLRQHTLPAARRAASHSPRRVISSPGPRARSRAAG